MLQSITPKLMAGQEQYSHYLTNVRRTFDVLRAGARADRAWGLGGVPLSPAASQAKKDRIHFLLFSIGLPQNWFQANQISALQVPQGKKNRANENPHNRLGPSNPRNFQLGGLRHRLQQNRIASIFRQPFTTSRSTQRNRPTTQSSVPSQHIIHNVER
jgi:hypothetical protein